MTTRPIIILAFLLLTCAFGIELRAQSTNDKQNLVSQGNAGPEKESGSPQNTSEQNAVLSKIAKLEAEVGKLEKKPKDEWDKFQIIGTLLIPASIALTGFLISKVIKRAEINSAERIAQGEKEVALINAKVSQAELIHSFLVPLTSEHPHQRKLAIQALLLALPEDGPRLIQILSESDPDANVQNFAEGKLAALTQRELIPHIFDSDVQISDQARDKFLSNGETDTYTLLKLMNGITLNHKNKHGALNALKILVSFGPYKGQIMPAAFKQMSDYLDRSDKDIQTALDTVAARFTDEMPQANKSFDPPAR